MPLWRGHWRSAPDEHKDSAFVAGWGARARVFSCKKDDGPVAGFYATSTLVLTQENWPLAFSILANQKIQSDIPSDDFVWSLSLTYAL